MAGTSPLGPVGGAPHQPPDMERKLQRSNSKMERWRVATSKVLFSLRDKQLPPGRASMSDV